MLWSLGKDSNVVLWLVKKAFFGHVPFPVMHVDTGKKFPEMYAFRERYAKEWGSESPRRALPADRRRRPDPAARRRARPPARPLGLKDADRQARLQRPRSPASAATRRRSAPRSAISARAAHDSAWNLKDQPPEFWDQYMTSFPPGTHVRVHPLLHWTEIDIWRYTKRESIPLIDLYFAKNGKRYRSLGDQDITSPIASDAATLDEIIAELETTRIPERSGRAMDHESEDAFERLRAAGYHLRGLDP